jgi:hypothetical protein
MVESTGQLPFPQLNGHLQVREMSADVRRRTISPKTHAGREPEQRPGNG